MIPKELRSKYYVTKVRVKRMGKNKKDKLFYSVEWNPSETRRAFLDEYNKTDPKGCGLFLCKVEWNDFTEDRFWDVPDYRDEAIRAYRKRINGIRSKYGLSKSEVADFMRV